MENTIKKRSKTRKRRVLRVRKTLKGTSEKPRLSVFKSNKHLYVQLIDDVNQKTILGVGTASKSLKATKFNLKSKEAAKHLGALIASHAKEKNIVHVVFDRGRNKYHGILAELAEAARNAGLQF